jgi:hypothetical protein
MTSALLLAVINVVLRETVSLQLGMTLTRTTNYSLQIHVPVIHVAQHLLVVYSFVIQSAIREPAQQQCTSRAKNKQP